MEDMTGYFALAHALPNRVRLRWIGEEDLNSAIVNRLADAAGGASARYRPRSRSLVLESGAPIDLDRLRQMARDVKIDIERPAPESLDQAPAAESNGAISLSLADLEAFIVLLFLLKWVRDAAARGTVRPGGLALILLTAFNLYEYWILRRSRRHEYEALSELEFI